MLVNLDLGQKIPHLSVNHQFGNVRGGQRIGTKTRNVIKVLATGDDRVGFMAKNTTFSNPSNLQCTWWKEIRYQNKKCD